jgi:hypothetical protein
MPKARKEIPDNHLTTFSESEFNAAIATATGYNYVVGEPVAGRNFGVIFNTTRTEANIYNRATPEGGRGRWCWQIVRK